MLATANRDGTVQIFTLPGTTARDVLPRLDAVSSVDFSPFAPQLAVAGIDGKVRIWDANARAFVGEIAVSGAPLNFARFSPDGEHIAAGGRDSGIHLLTKQGLHEATLHGHGGNVLDVDFDSSGVTVISSGADGTIRTWAQEDHVYIPGPVTTATFDRDAARIVSGGADGRLHVWRRADLTSLLDISDHTGYSHAIFSAMARGPSASGTMEQLPLETR